MNRYKRVICLIFAIIIASFVCNGTLTEQARIICAFRDISEETDTLVIPEGRSKVCRDLTNELKNILNRPTESLKINRQTKKSLPGMIAIFLACLTLLLISGRKLFYFYALFNRTSNGYIIDFIMKKDGKK